MEQQPKASSYRALWLATLQRVKEMNRNDFKYVEVLKQEHPVEHQQLTVTIPKAIDDAFSVGMPWPASESYCELFYGAHWHAFEMWRWQQERERAATITTGMVQ